MNTARNRGAVRIPALLCGVLMALAFFSPAGAMVGANTGGVWVQAPWKNKIELTNILSFKLGGNPAMYLKCLDQTFHNPAARHETIIAAAKACRAAHGPGN